MNDEQATGPGPDRHRVPAHAGAPAAHEHGTGTHGAPYGAPYGGSPYGGAPLGPPAPGPGGGGPRGPGGTGPLSSGAAGPAAGQPRRPRTMTAVVTAALIAGLVGGGAGFGGAYALIGAGSPGTTLTTSPSSPAAAATPGTVAGAAAVATPSTVDIRVTTAQGIAEGSGVVLSADGALLTNNHVVAGGSGQIQVTLSDGSEHAARVVGTSPSYDLAVLQVEGVSGLTPAVLGNSADVQVGQPVVAIGSPQGLTGTVTTGIVSAFDRTVTAQGEDGSAVVYNGLQTDAPINPGNSGGPLVDLQGRVVGINSAILTGSQGSGSIGLGFAIPVDQAKRVAQEIIDTGSATKPVLGVQGDPTATGVEGAQIAAVEAGSPAAGAGLVAGDVVTMVGDARVQDFADLIARVGSYAPGDEVTLTVAGAGGAAERTATVALGSVTDSAASTSSGGQSTNPFGGVSPFGN